MNFLPNPPLPPGKKKVFILILFFNNFDVCRTFQLSGWVVGNEELGIMISSSSFV